MNMKKILFCLLAIAFLYQPLHSQNKIAPVSPEAASLAKQINYPVNFNTGIPNIEVPLYEVSAGGLVLPIYLSYHAGGFKINEMSTSIGLGWSISADIQITRSINGLDDFIPGIGYIDNTKMKAYNPTSPTGTYPLDDLNLFYGRNSYDIATGKVDGMPDKFYYKLLNKTGSFYFLKNDAGNGYTIVPVPYDNIKIQHNNGQFTITDTDGTIYTFGEQGPASTSDMASKGIEFSGPFTNMYRSAWKCKRIVNATQTANIDFTYEVKSSIVYNVGSEVVELYNNLSPCNLNQYYTANDVNGSISSYETLALQYQIYNLSTPRYIERFPSGVGARLHMLYADYPWSVTDRVFTSSEGSPSSGSEVQGLALSSISFKGGSVVFSGTDKLSTMTVKDAGGQEVKSFQFFQTYTQALNQSAARSYNGGSYQGTLYLDSLHIKGAGNTYDRYAFLYQTKASFGSHLVGKDVWGQRNGSTRERISAGTFLSVPGTNITQRFYKDINGGCVNVVENAKFTIGSIATQLERPDSTPLVQQGLLKRIIYPTGGYVDFDFESNMYDGAPLEHVHAIKMGGGLRIRAINYFNGTSLTPVKQKYYRYGEMEDGIGLVMNSPARAFNIDQQEYEPFSYDQHVNYVTGPGTGNFGTDFAPVPLSCNNRGCMNVRFAEKKTTYMSASSQNYNFPNGAPVYYTKVTEYNDDFGKQTGKTVYTYYQPDEFGQFYYSITNKSKVPGTNIDVLQSDGLMGVQKSIEEYRFEKGKFKLQRSRTFEYEKYMYPRLVRVVYSWLNNIYVVQGGGFDGDDIDLYNSNHTFGGVPFLGGPDFIAGQYALPVARVLLSKETEKWYDGTNILTQTTDYTYKPGYMQPSAILTTNSKNKTLAKYIKYSYDFNGTSVYDQMTALNMISLPVELVIEDTLNHKEISRTRTNYGNISAGFGFIAPVSIQESSGGNALENKITFDRYDPDGNILQTTDRNGITTSYLWGYGYRYPVAEFIGVTYAEATLSVNVAALQSITSEQQLKPILNNLRTTVSNAMTNTFLHKPLVGITSKTMPNGQELSYIYDGIGRLQTIKDQDNRILKQYDYQVAGPLTSNAQSLYYVNVPMINSFMTTCSDGSRDMYNSIVRGGIYVSSSQAFADLAAEHSSENPGVNDIPDSVCSPVNYATITLTTVDMEIYLLPYPAQLFADLFQDGSLVYTQKFPGSYTYTNTMYVKPGIYKMGLRMKNNFNGSITRYWLYETDLSGTGIPVNPGDEVTIQPGYTYVLSATNVGF